MRHRHAIAGAAALVAILAGTAYQETRPRPLPPVPQVDEAELEVERARCFTALADIIRDGELPPDPQDRGSVIAYGIGICLDR